MLYPAASSSNEKDIYDALAKKGLWQPGRSGLLVLVVGLKWSHSVVQKSGSQFKRKHWGDFVRDVTEVLRKGREIKK